VQAFFKSKLAELAALSEGGASEDDLRALRAALEKEFKSTMAEHFAKKEEDKALATSRCLTCGQATNDQVTELLWMQCAFVFLCIVFVSPGPIVGMFNERSVVMLCR